MKEIKTKPQVDTVFVKVRKCEDCEGTCVIIYDNNKKSESDPCNDMCNMMMSRERSEICPYYVIQIGPHGVSREMCARNDNDESKILHNKITESK